MLQTITRMAVQKVHAQPEIRSPGFGGRRFRAIQRGFSLVEIALVLMIAGLALGAGISLLGSQLDNKKVSDTQLRIKESSEAMLAFAAVNRRLPCPASIASVGQEQWCTNAFGACGALITAPTPPPAHGRCANFNNGFVPSRTLGLEAQGTAGITVDAWTGNLRYAVSQTTYVGPGKAPVSVDCTGTCYPFTQTSGVRNAYYLNGVQDTIPNVGDLMVCATATGVTATTCGPPANQLSQAGFIVWSTSRNGTAGGVGLDEAANLNNDSVYISHPRAEIGAANGEFDDLLLWQTNAAVVSSMIKAGVLP